MIHHGTDFPVTNSDTVGSEESVRNMEKGPLLPKLCHMEILKAQPCQTSS